MVYKRTNMTLKNDTKVEYVESNNQGIYINTSVTGANFAPYHGIYIYESQLGNNVYLSKMIETLEIGHDTYDICDIKTSENVYTGVEYLTEFNSTPVPTYTYEIYGVTVIKKYKLVPNSKVLCIEYKIENNSGKQIKFSAKPCITRRGLFTPKRKSNMKFTSKVTPAAVKVALSISENLDIYLKSSNMKFNKKEDYITGVNYDYEEDDVKKTYIEDLYVPGEFTSNLKNGNTNTYAIYVALEDIDVRDYKSQDIELDIKSRDDLRYSDIDKSYHELLELAKAAYSLHYIDKDKKQLVLLESIPHTKDTADYIKNIIVSIEGNYLLLGRYKEAHKILESMMYKLKDKTCNLSGVDKCESILLFIEALNRYLKITEAGTKDIRPFYEYIKEEIYNLLDHKYEDMYVDKDHLIITNDKKYVKINSLWYNALRIFVDFADKFKEESEFIYSISENVRDNIIKVFWDKEKQILKYEQDDNGIITFDTIYSLSLSYQVIYDGKISMKIMDMAFKKLYTAYGMRKAEIGSTLYDGYVYPHLIVHFLKANLRQMGVTYASQKLAYNLVKETFANIGKDVVNTVKYKYSEKTKKAYGNTVNAITNAELIRAFDMLT